MTRYLFAFSFLLIAVQAFPQSWPGFETGRYSGISSANNRPGGMAATPFKVDATLFGAHFFTKAKKLYDNEDAFDMLSSGGFEGLKGFSELSSTKAFVYANLQGPSILYSINKKWSVAFAWNTRFLWTSRFSEPQLAKLFDKDVSTLDLSGTGETATVLFNTWNEFGLGAGGVIWGNANHSVSVGGFAKLVYGGGNLNFNLDNIEIQTEGDTIQKISMSIQANISQQTYELVDEGTLDLFDRAGYGFDIGAEYKFLNPAKIKDALNYKLMAGFSLTDLGQMRYRSATEYNQLNLKAENISFARFRNAPSFEAVVDTLEEIFDADKTSTGNYRVTLPMSARFYADLNLGKRLYIYNEVHLLFANITNEKAPLVFRYNLTPRFEDERFGVYLPLTFSNVIPANAGLSLRWKPFIIGSANLFTFWAYKETGQAFDIYLIIKIPILKKSPKENADKEINKPAYSF